MNKAEKFHQKVLKEMKTFSLSKHKHLFNKADRINDEYYHEMFGGTETHPREGRYYKYMACVVKLVQPKIVVEIGGDRGASAMAMYSELPKDSVLYTCDIENAYYWIPQEVYDNGRIVKVIGDSIDIKWPVDLSGARVWLIDGDHDSEHVRREIKIYSPFWKEGTVVMFDDVKQYRGVFESMSFDKVEDIKIHDNGFGVVKV